MNKKMLGIYVASATPFNAAGELDKNVLEQLIERNLEEKADGFFIGGSSAECFMLSHEERVATYEVASQFKDKADLIAHVGCLSTWEAIDYAKEAKRLGFQHIAATPPLYYGFTSEEVCSYYYDIARAVDMPLIVYNFPGNTKREFDLNDSNYQKLFTSSAIEGVKHTNQVVYQMERFMVLNPELKIWNGFDETMVAGLALGAQGSIGSTFNCMLPHYRKIYDAFLAGQIDEARQMQHTANNIMAAFCKVGLIAAVKYVLATQGIAAGDPRAPLLPLSDEAKAYVDKAIAENLIV